MTNAEMAAQRFKGIYREQITRTGAEDLLAWLETQTDFFTAPASTRYHGVYEGGLVKHSLNVYSCLNELEKTERWEKIADNKKRDYAGLEETVAICALLHDVCKADYYEREESGKYRVNDRFPFGHGEKSVLMISRFMWLTEEEALAIRWHMGAYDEAARGGSRTYSAALRFSPLVLELHIADIRATQGEQREEQA